MTRPTGPRATGPALEAMVLPRILLHLAIALQRLENSRNKIAARMAMMRVSRRKTVHHDAWGAIAGPLGAFAGATGSRLRRQRLRAEG